VRLVISQPVALVLVSLHLCFHLIKPRYKLQQEEIAAITNSHGYHLGTLWPKEGKQPFQI